MLLINLLLNRIIEGQKNKGIIKTTWKIIFQQPSFYSAIIRGLDKL